MTNGFLAHQILQSANITLPFLLTVSFGMGKIGMFAKNGCNTIENTGSKRSKKTSHVIFVLTKNCVRWAGHLFIFGQKKF